jgi:hypothetical protein
MKTWKTILRGDIPLITFSLYILLGILFWGGILLYTVCSLLTAHRSG